MSNAELSDHLTEQDRQDALEEARLLPIYAAQADALRLFERWLNLHHPFESPFEINTINKPYLRLGCGGDIVEFEGEGTDDLNYDTCSREDMVMVLWAVYNNQ